jgi:hypothetical protein
MTSSFRFIFIFSALLAVSSYAINKRLCGELLRDARSIRLQAFNRDLGVERWGVDGYSAHSYNSSFRSLLGESIEDYARSRQAKGRTVRFNLK